MKNVKCILLAVVVATFAGCDAWDDVKKLDSGDRSKNLYELLTENPDASIFTKALQTTGFDKKLAENKDYTVFVPSNSALSGVSLPTDTATLTQWVKNYISEAIVYTNSQGKFGIDRLLMLNDKYVGIDSNLVSGALVTKWNVASKNGVLHLLDGTIEERMSVWQYLKTLEGNSTVDFIASYDEKVMDMDRSVQIGVNSQGRPKYDTVWTYRNTFLDATPLADESATSTFLLLDESALSVLKAKYGKYFAQKDTNRMAKDIMTEITKDMILQYTKIDTDGGRYLNTSGVLVDVDASNIDVTSSYTASNGIVYKVSAAKVKMYNNKITNSTIEAENYVTRWPDAWQTRPRTWASGGYDVALKSRTRHSYDLYLRAVNGADSIVRIDNMYDLTYRSNEWPGSNTLGEPNAYISYKPRVYSVPYKIFWKAYDDNSQKRHIDARDTAMVFYQKMYVSFPGENVLTRTTTTNVITGNFSSTSKVGFTANHTIMAAKMTAGVNAETQLVRYKVNQGHSIYPSSYVLYTDATIVNPIPSTIEDIYGKGGILKCPYYGQATLFVSNTAMGEFTHKNGTVTAYLQAAKGSNAPGMIFLDYIRLEPQVDPND
jgi:uncharacterized surface protein with fasciclin (FAS1) repeats